MGKVKSLVVINGPIAEREGKFSCVPHTDAAYYADRIKARTLLIYADQEALRRGVAIWKQRNQAEDREYVGEHDFGKTPQSFDTVTKMVTDFLKESPDQKPRVVPLARRKRVRRKRTGRLRTTRTRQER